MLLETARIYLWLCASVSDANLDYSRQPIWSASILSRADNDNFALFVIRNTSERAEVAGSPYKQYRAVVCHVMGNISGRTKFNRKSWANLPKPWPRKQIISDKVWREVHYCDRVTRGDCKDNFVQCVFVCVCVGTPSRVRHRMLCFNHSSHTQ